MVRGGQQERGRLEFIGDHRSRLQVAAAGQRRTHRASPLVHDQLELVHTYRRGHFVLHADGLACDSTGYNSPNKTTAELDDLRFRNKLHVLKLAVQKLGFDNPCAAETLRAI